MPEIHEQRRVRLRALLAERGHEALLVSSLVNVRYLSGFVGSNGGLLVPADPAQPVVLATDGRYVEAAEAAVPDLEILLERDTGPGLAALAAGRGVRRLAYEGHDLTVDGLRAVQGAAGDISCVGGERVVETLRAVKDDVEIDALRRACAAGDAAFADVLGIIRPGLTELALADELEARMRAHGSQAPSFDSIVATGPNSAVPHHRPTDRAIASGDFVKVDFGATVDGYHSDMTRTVVVGEPADWQREVYAVVAAAQQAGVDAVVPGIATADVDRASRGVVERAGWGDRFVHGLGHGVGLQIHEAPALGSGSPGTIAPGMVLTIEPGVYVSGRGGVRIEDTLVVPADGGPAERITLTPRELLVL